MDQNQEHNTVDGLPPADQPIDNSQAINPTAEEAARTLALMNGDPSAPTPGDDAPKTVPQYAEDPRDTFTKNWRSRRDSATVEADQPAADPNDLAATYGADAVAGAPRATETHAPSSSAPETFKVKVDGVERDVTREELIASFQKNTAADKRLAEATRLLNEAKTVQKAPIAAEYGEDRSQELPPSTIAAADPSIPRGTKLDRGNLAKAVEMLQLGSIDDGVKALETVLENVAPQQAPVDLRTEVDVVLNSRAIERESTEASSAFLARYPELQTDPIWQNMAGELIAGEMARDFVAAGMSKEQVAAAMPNRQAALALHNAMRVRDPGFGRGMGDLMKAIEAHPSFKRYAGNGAPAQVTVNVNRQERKAAVPQQPALRTPPVLSQSQQQPVSQSANRSKAVEAMRLARGQQVIA